LYTKKIENIYTSSLKKKKTTTTTNIYPHVTKKSAINNDYEENHKVSYLPIKQITISARSGHHRRSKRLKNILCSSLIWLKINAKKEDSTMAKRVDKHGDQKKQPF